MSSSKAWTVFSFFKYWLNAVDAHSLQSPFAFDFYESIVASKKNHQDFLQIERLRQKLQKDHRAIQIKDYGAGSRRHVSSRRKISDIVHYGISRPRFSQMLYRLVSHYKPQNIIELGTSLGVNTLYLAKANHQNQVTTFEGCPQLAAVARENFDRLRRDNIKLIEGDLNYTLQAHLATTDQVDLVFFDANHQFEPILGYFNQCLEKAHSDSIFIFDDIHWSGEMEKAWSKIKSEPSVTLSFDLFQAGIVCFAPTATKQELVLEVPFW
ncbi:MAG: O-methyltransferase [Cyclobacteriaceae bacterium]